MAGSVHLTAAEKSAVVDLPDILKRNLVNWTPVVWHGYTTATPLFWHIPLSGGNVVESALAGCLGLLLASGAARDAPETRDD
eukprot:14976720-Ditylum_brightwellii.AAC.1